MVKRTSLNNKTASFITCGFLLFFGIINEGGNCYEKNKR